MDPTGLKGCRRLSINATMTSSKIQNGGLARRALEERSGSRCYSKFRSSEFLYVDEDHHSHLWDRNSVPCAVRMRSGLRMRSSESCVKTTGLKGCRRLSIKAAMRSSKIQDDGERSESAG